MKFRTIHIAIVILSFASFASSALVNLPPPEEKFKILMLLPFASKSHRNCFLPLAESLAERGHEIVILSPLPPTNKHPNIEEINHGIDVVGNVSMFHVRETDPSGGFQFFEIILPVLAREMYDVPEVKKLYESRSQFDMFIIDGMFNEPAYPFLVNENFISISTAGVMPDTSATLGNFLNPAYVPSLFGDFPRPYSFVNRALNLFFHIVFPLYWRTYSIFPIVEKELLKKFPNLPPLGEIEKGMVLEIANGHYTLHESKPLLPSQIEAGGMHCQKAKTLPKDLKNFIEGSGEKGVIYFSLGSVCESKTMPEKFKKVLLGAFQKIKYRVIWKFEEEFPNLPSNIMVQKWLPQQDILGHPKVKLFITHGGLLSMQESIYHSKPLLALPIFGDQLKNAQNILKRGYGTYLVWEDLTEDLIISTISELIDNPKYMTEVVKVSKKFRDQHVPPLERAVWWTEYVIRNKDDLPTKSPAADLSWIEYLMIDVILALHALVFAIYFICKKIIKGVIAACSSSRSQSSSKKKKE